MSTFTVRPPLLQIDDCENATAPGVTLRDSPFRSTHVIYSDDMTIRDASIQNPPDAPNDDGIGIDSSHFAKVNDTHIDISDNAIYLKSGKDEQGREAGCPTKNVVITSCTVEHDHGGATVGNETIGGTWHVTATDCIFTDTDYDARTKSKRGRSGMVEGLRFDAIIVYHITCLFVINGYYQTGIGSGPRPVAETTSNIRNVDFHHVAAEEIESTAFPADLPE